MGFVFIVLGIALSGIGAYRRQAATKDGQQPDRSSIVQIVLGIVVLLYGIVSLVMS